MAADDRVIAIAISVRRFQLLAEPVMFGASREELPDRLRRRAEIAPLSLLHAALVGDADDADRICAAAVRVLRAARTKAASDAILALLDCLDADRKIALYFALPHAARRALDRHPAFARTVQPVRDEMDAALFDLDELSRVIGEELFTAIREGEPGRALRWAPERFRRALREALIRAA